MNRRYLLLLWSIGTLNMACGTSSLSHTVNPDYLRDMSQTGRIWIYDAENEVVVAYDRLDEAFANLQKVKKRIREAEKALDNLEKKNKRSVEPQISAWHAYCEQLEDWANKNIELRKVNITLARASVELAKAQVIHREDLLAGKEFSVKKYQDQYGQWKERFSSLQKEVDVLYEQARNKEKEWWSVRRRYVAQTGDYDSGLWSD